MACRGFLIFCFLGFLLNACVGLIRYPSSRGVCLKMATASGSARDADRVHVEVISDFACPWCYVGKARLDAAIEAFVRSSSSPDDGANTRVHVSFRPYMIDPRTKLDGEEYLAYNKRRWGGDGWTASLKRSSRKDGCEFSKWVTWPNSLLAHRLQKFADDAGKGAQVNNLVFQTIYERGGNASDLETLVSLAGEAGLSAADARAYLTSRDGEEDVLREDHWAKDELGVTGVPCFVVRVAGGRTNPDAAATATASGIVGVDSLDGGRGQSKIVLNGAVAPDDLLRAFENIRRM